MSTETEDLELLRGLLEKATPGPWSIYKHFNAPEGLHTWEIKGETRDDDIADGMLKEDAVLIAALRNALPSLLSRTQAAEKALEEAGKENARLRTALESVRAALHNENRLNTLSITDVIWVSEIETAVDCIDSALGTPS